MVLWNGGGLWTHRALGLWGFRCRRTIPAPRGTGLVLLNEGVEVRPRRDHVVLVVVQTQSALVIVLSAHVCFGPAAPELDGFRVRIPVRLVYSPEGRKILTPRYQNPAGFRQRPVGVRPADRGALARKQVEAHIVRTGGVPIKRVTHGTAFQVKAKKKHA